MRDVVVLCALSWVMIGAVQARASWEPATGFDASAKQITDFMTVGSRLYALGSVVQYSDDAGRTWAAATKVPAKTRGLVAFRDTLYVVSEGGEVHAAGAIEGPWKRVHRADYLGNQVGIVATPSALWVHGKPGLIRSADGKSFKRVPLGATFEDWAIAGLAEVGGGKLVALAEPPNAYGGGFVITSDDAGKTWTRPLAGAEGTTLHAQGQALIVASAGRIQRSTDCGATWAEVWRAPGGEVRYNPYSDPGAGVFAYASTGSGVVTLDGGATWHEPYLPLDLQSPVLGAVRQGDTVWAIAAPFYTNARQPMLIQVRKLELLVTTDIDANRAERCAIVFDDLAKMMQAAGGTPVDAGKLRAAKDECKRSYASELVACLGQAKTLEAFDACSDSR